jgi:hypothetical protein
VAGLPTSLRSKVQRGNSSKPTPATSPHHSHSRYGYRSMRIGILGPELPPARRYSIWRHGGEHGRPPGKPLVYSRDSLALQADPSTITTRDTATGACEYGSCALNYTQHEDAASGDMVLSMAGHRVQRGDSSKQPPTPASSPAHSAPAWHLPQHPQSILSDRIASMWQQGRCSECAQLGRQTLCIEQHESRTQRHTPQHPTRKNTRSEALVGLTTKDGVIRNARGCQ